MLKTVCPCLFDEQSGKLVEMSPFKDSSSDNGDQAPETMADKAKGWLSKAAAPIATFQAQRAEAAAHAERVDKLKAGTSMQLLPTGRGAPQPVRIAVSSDGAMVTWQSISGPTVSGVLALSAVREVKPVTAQGILRSGGPVPLQFQLVADDQTVKLEASSETEKDEWMNTLEAARKREADAKVGRKMAYTAKRRLGMEQKQREAERRKAEILKTCASGGMRHTAAAMMNRA